MNFETEVPPRAQCSLGEKREKKEKRETDYYRNLRYANLLNMEYEGLKHSKTKRSLKEFVKAYILYSAPFTKTPIEENNLST